MLSDRMVLAAWCPYWTKVYSQRYPSPILYYLSGKNRRHYPRYPPHPDCMPEGPCKVYDTDVENHTPQHAPNCLPEHCELVGLVDKGSDVRQPGDIPALEVKGPDLSQLLRIIRNGGIPLIRCQEIRQDKVVTAKSIVTFEIVAYTINRPFIAVSHVWAGGLGNIKTNTLPQCQLNYLYYFARKCQQKRYGDQIRSIIDDDRMDDDGLISNIILGAVGEDTGTVYLWIDILCIPAAKDRFRDLYSKCLDQMAQIYALAMHTLIIDHEVRNFPGNVEDSDLALAVELATCPWMCRSWTFHEACLSREISFALSDRVVNPRRLARRLSVGSGEIYGRLQRRLFYDLLHSYRGMPDVMNQACQPLPKVSSLEVFINVWNELAIRRTTFPDDLHKIFAALLGLSVQEICQGVGGQIPSASERIKGIIRSQEHLPLSMLFLQYPEGVELCSDSENWLPQFPVGTLDSRMGRMSWSGTGLQFTLKDNKSCAFIYNGLHPEESKKLSVKLQKDTLSKNTHFSVDDGYGCISFTLNESKVQAIDWDQSFIFVIHNQSGNGAFFHLIEKTGKFMRLKHICAVTYGIKEKFMRLKHLCPVGIKEITSVKGEDSSSNQSTTNEKRVIRCEDDAICFLDCDSGNWPKPRYRRLLQTPKQFSLTVPIGTWVCLHWAIWAIRLTQDPRYVVFSASAATASKFIAALARIPIAGVFFGPRQYTVRYFNPFMVLLGRCLVFVTVDYHRLEAIAERVRYERLAQSFEYVPVTELNNLAPLLSNLLREKPSYQFPRAWLLAIPVGASVFFWLFGKLISPRLEPLLKPIMCHFLFSAELLRPLAKGILWEVVGRIGVEFIWRYFRLDLEIPTPKKEKQKKD